MTKRNVRQKARKHCDAVKEFTRNALPWAICTIIGGVIFWRTYYKYKFCSQYFYLYNMLGESLGWSRGSAAVLWVSCSFVLLPMCKNLLAFIRNRIPKFAGRNLGRFLDRNLWTHKACALITIVAAAIHTIAHLINGKHFSDNYSVDHPELNFAEYKNQDPLEFVLFSVAGSTGISMMFILLVMISASAAVVRDNSYEVFWFTHHLFPVFYVLLCVHGLGGVVKHQTNIARHPPGCDKKRTANHTAPSALCQEPALFEADEPQAWKFVAVPLSIYVLDRLVRILRSFQQVNIVEVVQHPCDVYEIRMKMARLDAQPGQYVYIRCPDISRLEWHPFTLTKCPTAEEKYFSIHFQIAGDWTRRFAQTIAAFQGQTEKRLSRVVYDGNHSWTVDVVPSTVRICVDGPYGSPCMDVKRYEVSLCIATGIGVTPFAAVLASLRLDELLKPRTSGSLRRIYFIWVGRNVDLFHWFVDILHSKHLELWNRNRPDILVCQFYMTGTQQETIQKQPCTNQGGTSSWFHTRLTRGRPDWQAIFTRVGRENPRSTVGVFYCGTKSASPKLRRLCFRSTKPIFVYNKEVLG